MPTLTVLRRTLGVWKGVSSSKAEAMAGSMGDDVMAGCGKVEFGFMGVLSLNNGLVAVLFYMGA